MKASSKAFIFTIFLFLLALASPATNAATNAANKAVTKAVTGPLQAPPVLQLQFTPATSKPSQKLDFVIHAAQCYAYLFRALGQRPWQLPWQNLEPFASVSLKTARSGRESPLAGHYLVAKNTGWAKQRQALAQDNRLGLYLAHHSGAAFGDALIITKGMIPKLDRTHLYCGTTASPNRPSQNVWPNQQTGRVAARLLGSRHPVVRYPFLPALSRGKAENLTIKAARKAARSMATTFELASPTALTLANYRRQGELIQVNYTVSFPDRSRDLVLIGAYTNGVFAAEHLHFSK